MKTGANFTDANRIRRLAEAGEYTLEQISMLTQVNPTTVRKIIDAMGAVEDDEVEDDEVEDDEVEDDEVEDDED